MALGGVKISAVAAEPGSHLCLAPFLVTLRDLGGALLVHVSSASY